MKRFALTLLCLSALLFCACEKKIDASTAEKWEKSMTAIAKSLPPEKSTQFTAAIASISINVTTMVTLETIQEQEKQGGSIRDSLNLAALAGQQAKIEKRMAELLDGRTAEEVLVVAEQVQRQIDEMALTRAKTRLAELDAKIEATKAQMAGLATQVPTSGYKLIEKLGRREAVVLVTNNLDFPIEKVELELLYIDPKTDKTVAHEIVTSYTGDEMLQPGEARPMTFIFDFMSSPFARGRALPAGAKVSHSVIAVAGEQRRVPEIGTVELNMLLNEAESLKKKHSL